MALINISGLAAIDNNNIDPEYRYKMPQPVCKIEGRGNGIKTAILNLADIARALQRSVDEIRKFIGYGLCTQTHNEAANNRITISGEFRQSDIQLQIFKFIERFVLCRECGLPETVYRFGKHHLSYKCRSCGYRDTIEHKLTKFIIKTHQESKKARS
jgi:translation initiation factor 5